MVEGPTRFGYAPVMIRRLREPQLRSAPASGPGSPPQDPVAALPPPARVSLLELLCLAGGLLLLFRYRWLMDDAFVYFRYIDNFLFLKVGLVYNQYEYVEGFSSPAWLLILLGLRLTRIDYWHATMILGAAAFSGFWYGLVRLNRRLSPRPVNLNFPLVYLAANYAVLSYFTSGLETPVTQLMAVAYALFIIDPGSRPLQLALAVSPLVRPELALPLLLAAAWSWRRRRRFPAALVTLSLAGSGAWLLFRIYYYADLLPNPFYLKNDTDLEQGFYYLHETLSTYHFYAVAVLCLMALLYLGRSREQRSRLRLPERAIMLLAAVSVAAYIVKIGGDPRHYRYLAFPFCLAAAATAGVPEAILARLGRHDRRAIFALGAAVFAAVFLCYPPQLDRHPVTRREHHRMVHKVTDASFHRRNPGLAFARWGKVVTIPKMLEYRKQHPRYIQQKIITAGWCAKIYRQFDARAIHQLGLTDAILARTDVPANRPGHKKSLIPLARALARLQASVGWVGRGMYRTAVANRKKRSVPDWIVKNIDSIEIIEQKIYNRHDFFENIRLAFTWPRRITP